MKKSVYLQHYEKLRFTFLDFDYFIRMFKKETGMTPAAYRRQGGIGLKP